MVVCLVFYLWFCNKFTKSYRFPEEPQQVRPSKFEFLYSVVSVLTVLLQTFMKISSKKGLFMLNPCHINLVFVTALMLLPISRFIKLVHLAWEPWIFGPIFALLFPHLDGISQFEIYLYYVEHILIFPLGQLLLTRRYGGLDFPSLKNQIFGFGTTIIYQYALLAPVSDWSLVNLNFTLCHSPADAGFDLFGYWYFFVASIYLNFFSYIFLILMWPVKKLFTWIFFAKPVKWHTE